MQDPEDLDHRITHEVDESIRLDVQLADLRVVDLGYDRSALGKLIKGVGGRQQTFEKCYRVLGGVLRHIRRRFIQLALR